MDKVEAYIVFVLIAIVFLIGLFVGDSRGYDRGREAGIRQGQIDYANGKITVHLEKQSDGSMVWVMK